jgi:hypothetical protein
MSLAETDTGRNASGSKPLPTTTTLVQPSAVRSATLWALVVMNQS